MIQAGTTQAGNTTKYKWMKKWYKKVALSGFCIIEGVLEVKVASDTLLFIEK